MLNAKLTLVNGLFSLKSRDFFLKKKYKSNNKNEFC